MALDEEAIRGADRADVDAARRSGLRWRVLILVIGPGILTMLGENDGPSMISYAATGRTFGFSAFLPFIVVTFAAAAVCQEMCMRVGAVTGRGHGELVLRRYGPWWGWFAAVDLSVTNFVTLVAEFVALRLGFSFFGIGAPLAIACGVGLVVCNLAGRRYRRWERGALCLAAFNALFVVAALLAHPTLGQIGESSTVAPLVDRPGTALLLVVSTIGATITPWMVFFQQSAVVDKGLTTADLRQGSADVVVGSLAAALCAVGAYVAAAAARGASGGSGVAGLVAAPARSIFAVGLIEAGALAILTISASSAYAVGECIGLPHSFNARATRARAFYSLNVAMPAIAGALVLVPRLPLVAVALDANALATILLPVTLVFLLLLANDRALMGAYANGPLRNILGLGVSALVVSAGVAWALVSFAHLGGVGPGIVQAKPPGFSSPQVVRSWSGITMP